MRNKIKMFAQKKVTLPPGRHKIVILDEADRYCWHTSVGHDVIQINAAPCVPRHMCGMTSTIILLVPTASQDMFAYKYAAVEVLHAT